MIRFQVDRFTSERRPVSTKAAHRALVSAAESELLAARAEHRAARIAAGLPVATQKPSPTIQPAGALSTKERRQALKDYESELAHQQTRGRQAAELQKISQRFAKGN